jgi:hypothetical protein
MLNKDQTKRATITDLFEDEWLSEKGQHRINLYFNENDYNQINLDYIPELTFVSENSHQASSTKTNDQNLSSHGKTLSSVSYHSQEHLATPKANELRENDSSTV